MTGVDGDDLPIRATKRVADRGSADPDALDRGESEERGNRVVVGRAVLRQDAIRTY